MKGKAFFLSEILNLSKEDTEPGKNQYFHMGTDHTYENCYQISP